MQVELIIFTFHLYTTHAVCVAVYIRTEVDLLTEAMTKGTLRQHRTWYFVPCGRRTHTGDDKVAIKRTGLQVFVKPENKRSII